MTTVIGLIIAALGAVLKFAINDQADDINLETVGVILIILGLVIAIIGLFRHLAPRRTERVVETPAGVQHEQVVSRRPYE